MLNFIYISNTKLDVLLPQVQRALVSRTDKASVSLKLDLKVLSSEIKFGEALPDVHRTKLIARLTEYIQQNTFCCSVADDGEYIHDTLSVRLLRHSKPDEYEERGGYFCPLDEGQICFGGKCPGGAFAFLGSQHHIIGAARAEDVLFPGSFPMPFDTDSYPILFDACNHKGLMKVEILAIRHQTHRFRYAGVNTRFVVGSPIYVALS